MNIFSNINVAFPKTYVWLVLYSGNHVRVQMVFWNCIVYDWFWLWNKKRKIHISSQTISCYTSLLFVKISIKRSVCMFVKFVIKLWVYKKIHLTLISLDRTVNVQTGLCIINGTLRMKMGHFNYLVETPVCSTNFCYKCTILVLSSHFIYVQLALPMVVHNKPLHLLFSSQNVC